MITFKPLENSDVEIIIKMMQDFYALDNYPIDVQTSGNLFKTFISNESLGRCYLILNEKEVVGYVILTFVFSFEYNGQIAFVDELYIQATHRSQGIGQKTIDFIKTEAKNLDIKLLYLEVENHNEAAQKLYLKNNFEIHNRSLMKFTV